MARPGALVLALSLTSPPQAGPVEGPAAPAAPDAVGSAVEPEPEPGIEFAVPPPSFDAAPTGEAESPPPPVSTPIEIGKAPDNGGALLAGGLWLVPLSAYGTALVVNQHREAQGAPSSEPWIWVTGAGLAAIGISMIGVGAWGNVKLKRWAKRHRVRALPQGRGLLTSGTLALVAGAGLVAGGVSNGDDLSLGIGVAMLVSAPIQIGIGIPFAINHRAQGGWRRTRMTLGPGGLRLDF